MSNIPTEVLARRLTPRVSFNLPQEADVSTEEFEQAIDAAETELGFQNQPRAVVFHEKNARRHCHVVWSRIDAEEMKAIPVPYYKNRLMDISRDLYLQHGWQMPKGINTKQVKAKLGEPDTLPAVEEAKTEIAKTMTQRLQALGEKQQSVIKARLEG